jgi:hypothetical protein
MRKRGIRPADERRAVDIDARLLKFDEGVRPLLGIRNADTRAVLVAQIIESLRRIEFVQIVRDQKIDPQRADPSSFLFDPIRAAAFWMSKGKQDEAFWLIFLATHFGKHVKYGWGLTRAVYGGSNGLQWSWQRVSADVEKFRDWLSEREADLRARYAFSNHRKYQSLSARSATGTGAVVASYVKWIEPPRTHQQMVHQVHLRVGQNPREVFGALYKSMDNVIGFGRLGKFDFLTMLGKLGIAPIEPGSAYLVGATGPVSGARLLFSDDVKHPITPRALDAQLIELDAALGVGMQVLEDSLCNWQKSPGKFVSFRG